MFIIFTAAAAALALSGCAFDRQGMSLGGLGDAAPSLLDSAGAWATDSTIQRPDHGPITFPDGPLPPFPDSAPRPFPDSREPPPPIDAGVSPPPPMDAHVPVPVDSRPSLEPDAPGPTGGREGAKCPPACASGFACAAGRCFKRCVFDGCEVSTDCGATQYCFRTSTTKSEGICVGGRPAGDRCSLRLGEDCAGVAMCVKVSGASARCLKLCNGKYGNCSSGLKCKKVGGAPGCSVCAR